MDNYYDVDDLLDTTFDEEDADAYETPSQGLDALKAEFGADVEKFTQEEIEGTLKKEVSKCPLDCIDGQIFDFVLRKMKPCPECKNKRLDIVKTEIEKSNKGEKSDLVESLNIAPSYLTQDFDFDMLIPKYWQERITKDSLFTVKKMTEDMFANAVLGKAPTHSMLINFGHTADISHFINIYLLKCYANGLKVAPWVDATMLNEMRSKQITDEEQKWGTVYKHYLESDVCVVTITAGATKHELRLIRGLMQDRAKREKATVIITNEIITEPIRQFVDYNNSKALFTARLYSVEYQKYQKKPQTNNNNNGNNIPKEVVYENEYHGSQIRNVNEESQKVSSPLDAMYKPLSSGVL